MSSVLILTWFFEILIKSSSNDSYSKRHALDTFMFCGDPYQFSVATCNMYFIACDMLAPGSWQLTGTQTWGTASPWKSGTQTLVLGAHISHLHEKFKCCGTCEMIQMIFVIKPFWFELETAEFSVRSLGLGKDSKQFLVNSLPSGKTDFKEHVGVSNYISVFLLNFTSPLFRR